MSYSANAIANYFLNKARDNGDSLNPIKLQKLVYYAHGWFLSITHKPLLNEYVEARRYGPVIASLYYEFRDFGISDIPRQALTHDIDNDKYYIENVSKEDTDTLDILNRVYQVYGQKTDIELANMTHVKDGPWYAAMEKAGDMVNTHIDNDCLMEYFTALGLEPEVYKMESNS